MTDLRLIDKTVLKEGVELINDFSKGLNLLGKSRSLSKKDLKELHDKIFKGNEATVAEFLDSHPDICETISTVLEKEITGFSLSYNPHGIDGYFQVKDGTHVPVEIKTTTGKLVPTHRQQRRKTDIDVNVKYTAGFKFHFTSTGGTFDEEFKQELSHFDEGQITILAGLYDNDCGIRKVSDIFMFTPEQSKELLHWGRANRCNEKLIQFDPTLFMNGGQLNNLGTYVVSTKLNT